MGCLEKSVAYKALTDYHLSLTINPNIWKKELIISRVICMINSLFFSNPFQYSNYAQISSMFISEPGISASFG
jgi:hypothetical protein